MTICDRALESIAVEQRRLGRPTYDKGKLPRDVRAVHEGRIDPFPAHRTRKMSRVTQQEAPAVAQGRNNTLVHLEVRSPTQIGEADVGSNPGVEQRGEIVGG